MFERKEWVDCKTPEELGKVLKFLYKNQSGMPVYTFPVFARLSWDLNGTSSEIENYGVYVPRKFLESEGIRDAINTIKKGD